MVPDSYLSSVLTITTKQQKLSCKYHDRNLPFDTSVELIAIA